MSVGSELKAARKKAGLTVEVISKRTKINVGKLVALEKNDFKNLPTGLYLFSAVRAYAREVHINPEPFVERLRTEFADKDALDALQALDAAGALDTKYPGNGRSKEKQARLLKSAAIAAGVVLMGAAGAGAYIHSIAPSALEAPLPLPAPAATVAAAVVMPQQALGADHRPPPTKTDRPKPRIAAVIPEQQEPVATVSGVSEEPADIPAHIEEPGPEAPVLATAP